MKLVTGKSMNIPGGTVGNNATDSSFDSEAVQKIMERHQDLIKRFREIEYSEKIKKAAKCRSGVMNNRFYKEGEEVFFIRKRTRLLGMALLRCFVREEEKFTSLQMEI